jgi:hypothetical protein
MLEVDNDINQNYNNDYYSSFILNHISLLF